uniref:Uncharacterized protein n=1 Tax=Tetraselmis sp. GSL018 TaxID=582737 RepID=A0A061QQ65_9CHLO
MTDQLQRLPGVAEMLSRSWVFNCPQHRDETSWADIMSGPVGTWPCAATDLVHTKVVQSIMYNAELLCQATAAIVRHATQDRATERMLKVVEERFDMFSSLVVSSLQFLEAELSSSGRNVCKLSDLRLGMRTLPRPTFSLPDREAGDAPYFHKALLSFKRLVDLLRRNICLCIWSCTDWKNLPRSCVKTGRARSGATASQRTIT